MIDYQLICLAYWYLSTLSSQLLQYVRACNQTYKIIGWLGSLQNIGHSYTRTYGSVYLRKVIEINSLRDLNKWIECATNNPHNSNNRHTPVQFFYQKLSVLI